MPGGTKSYDIIAATGCPTGVAHTFMAKDALVKAAHEKGLSIKVETHGQVGVEDELTPLEIRTSGAVIVAADKDVDAERFAGKPLVEVSVSAAIRDAPGLIDAALAMRPKGGAAEEDDAVDAVLRGGSPAVAPGGPRESVGHVIYKHLMNGVSHMLVFVVAGGVLTALSFLFGISASDSTSASYNQFAALLKYIGSTAMNLMVPIMAGYIAESIGKRPALVPGFVGGMIALDGLPISTATGLFDPSGTGVGAGFLGGVLAGFVAGYFVLFLERVTKGFPESLNGFKAIFLYPILSAFVVGSIMCLVSTPMVAINEGMKGFLLGARDASPIVVGIIVGCMCAFDMGGPVNKAAFVTGAALLAADTVVDGPGAAFMAGVSAACMTPPFVTTFAALIGRKYFTKEERDAAYVNALLGSSHITEGAIPFAVKNLIPVIPIFMLSSSIAASLTYLWGIHDPAIGGFLALPVVDKPVLWIVAILGSGLVGGALYALFKKHESERGQAEEAA